MIEHGSECTIITIDERQPYGFPDTVATIRVPYQNEKLMRLQSATKDEVEARCGKEHGGIEIPNIGRVSIFYEDDSADMFTSGYRGGTSWVGGAFLEMNDGRVFRLEVASH